MKLIEHVGNRLTGFGLSVKVHADQLEITRPNQSSLVIRIEDEYKDAFDIFTKARSTKFDQKNRILEHNNSVEVLLTKLNPLSLSSYDAFTFDDAKGNEINIGSASMNYAFSFFNSSDYDNFFNKRIKARLLESKIVNRRMNTILWTPITATFKAKGRKTPSDLKAKALTCISSTLFKIAVEQNECYNIWTSKNPKIKSNDIISSDNLIPRATYEENAVSFYKVAKSSPFPSQSFLAYYHVIEYYFLTVSESKLQDRLCAMINNPSFHSTKASLDKLISTVRGQDARNDETQMLRNVLDRYVQESDLIDFILRLETEIGEKIYTKKRKIFGEELQVSAIKDHALSNSANVIKHIRNAIVHSSDRYKREDCHIPLSHTEEIIEEFIPLIKFLSEKAIYGNAI